MMSLAETFLTIFLYNLFIFLFLSYLLLTAFAFFYLLLSSLLVTFCQTPLFCPTHKELS